MAARPRGTDGSDHMYREVIAERYRRMADFKHTITRLMGAHMVLALAKAAWASLGLLEGHQMPVYILGILAGEVAVMGTFAAAKLGNVKESLTALKVYNMVQAFVLAAQVLTGWRYHTGLNMVGRQYSKIAQRQLLQRLPGQAPETVLQVAEAAELTLDLAFGTLLMMAVLISHSMIKEKMDAKKSTTAAKGGAAAAQRAAVEVDAAAEAAGGQDSPERRVTAKASMRQRRRMA